MVEGRLITPYENLVDFLFASQDFVKFEIWPIELNTSLTGSFGGDLYNNQVPSFIVPNVQHKTRNNQLLYF